MVFSNLIFLYLFLPVCLIAYFFCPGIRAKNAVLILFSLIFYAWGEPVYLLLMIASAAVNWYFGLLIERRRKKIFLILALVLDLGCLAVFKYAGFFVENLNAVFGASIPVPQIALPIGISFYTFQALSYTVDVWRGDVPAQRSFAKLLLYISLFPQLIAGPIVRYKDVASQLGTRCLSSEQFSSGVQRFAIGLGKKVLLANNIGALWDIYAAAPELSFAGAWLGALAFSLQLYFDFSGYSDMAIGLGRMLGFEFLENFNYPYISKSVTEFWRRWHMSLGTWFRDYLYIPLGGNRRGLPRQILNILIVWALTGLWHGANWTFLLWGLYYAVFLILEKVFLLKKLEKVPVLAHIYALLVAVVGWMLFQLNSVGEVVHYWGAMFGASGAAATAADAFYARSYAVILFVAAIAATPVPKKLFQRIPQRVQNVLTPVLVALSLVISTAYLVDATYNPFLYFRF